MKGGGREECSKGNGEKREYKKSYAKNKALFFVFSALQKPRLSFALDALHGL